MGSRGLCPLAPHRTGPAGLRPVSRAPSPHIQSPCLVGSLRRHCPDAESCLPCLPGAYVPEGLLTSCSWDYMSFTPAVRAYTMLLFCFVFFLPLLVIIYCYVFIFRAIRETGQ